MSADLSLPHDSATRSLDIRLIAAGLLVVGAIAPLAGAWGFELIGHYVPCKLCLEQRIPYYIGIPVAVVALMAAATGRDRLARTLLLILAGLFLWSLYLGVRHAGVEWKWWEGPGDCGITTQPRTRDVGNLLGNLDSIRIAQCTEASWRFPNASWGLSFAGWNAVFSAGLVTVALIGAAWRRRPA